MIPDLRRWWLRKTIQERPRLCFTSEIINDHHCSNSVVIEFNCGPASNEEPSPEDDLIQVEVSSHIYKYTVQKAQRLCRRKDGAKSKAIVIAHKPRIINVFSLHRATVDPRRYWN